MYVVGGGGGGGGVHTSMHLVGCAVQGYMHAVFTQIPMVTIHVCPVLATCMSNGGYICVSNGGYTCISNGGYPCMSNGGYTCMSNGGYPCVSNGGNTCMSNGGYTCVYVVLTPSAASRQRQQCWHPAQWWVHQGTGPGAQ